MFSCVVICHVLFHIAVIFPTVQWI